MKNAKKKRSPWIWAALICLGLILLVLLIIGIIYAALPSSDSTSSSVVARLNDAGCNFLSVLGNLTYVKFL